jgi:inhibitor of the pro-sigma K processing machinery
MALLYEIFGLLLAFVLIYVLWKILKLIGYLVANSIMGILVFWALNAFLGLGVAISFLSVAIVAIAGVPGVLLVLLIHFLGLGF